MYEFRLRLQVVPKVRINNIPTSVQIMAWRRPRDKPLSESMLVSLLAHICVTRSQASHHWQRWHHVNWMSNRRTVHNPLSTFKTNKTSAGWTRTNRKKACGLRIPPPPPPPPPLYKFKALAKYHFFWILKKIVMTDGGSNRRKRWNQNITLSTSLKRGV